MSATPAALNAPHAGATPPLCAHGIGSGADHVLVILILYHHHLLFSILLFSLFLALSLSISLESYLEHLIGVWVPGGTSSWGVTRGREAPPDPLHRAQKPRRSRRVPDTRDGCTPWMFSGRSFEDWRDGRVLVEKGCVFAEEIMQRGESRFFHLILN